MTPTYSRAHDYFASAPFVLLFLYVPPVLFYGGRYLSALISLAVPAICDFLMALSTGGSSGELQKLNVLLCLALLNFVYYRILPTTHPLFYSPYLEQPKPRGDKVLP